MRDEKRYIALDDFERRIVVDCMNEKRNKLIADSKSTISRLMILRKLLRAKIPKRRGVHP